jgi:ubiquitin carboxyl-terminal hydrolase 7
VVHSGDVNDGHYYVFVRPERNEKWFRFDDEEVVPTTEFEVVEQNFGGDDGESANAVMLVYVRETEEQRAFAKYSILT